MQDTADGLSEFPHAIVNQARIHDYLLGFMANTPTRMAPHYGLELTGLSVDRSREHPIHVRLHDMAAGTDRTVSAKYVVGCDGARSRVRSGIDRILSGDPAGHAWGVMDVLASTDFPDIRLKCAIQSEQDGSILIIPREGGYLVRLYVDLGVVTDDNRAQIRSMSAEQVVDVARRVLHPYTLDVAATVWFSVYEVAQRLTDAFDDAAGRGVDPRVFIAGDACHTHSAKAGQGMNVSMQDTLNLGWKLAAVLRGRAKESLLQTYSAERQPVAQELIDFDREWSTMMAARPTNHGHREQDGPDSGDLADYYVNHGRYTAGVATRGLTSIPGSIVTTWLSDRLHRRRAVTDAMIAIAALGVLLIPAADGTWLWIPALLVGFAFNGCFARYGRSCQARIPPYTPKTSASRSVSCCDRRRRRVPFPMGIRPPRTSCGLRSRLGHARHRDLRLRTRRNPRPRAAPQPHPTSSLRATDAATD